MTSSTPNPSAYAHIVACYGSDDDEWTTTNPMLHITLRKGFCMETTDDPIMSCGDEIQKIHKDLVSLLPPTFQCKPHKWHSGWWDGSEFMNAHRLLLTHTTFKEAIPYWLLKDIKKSPDPTKMKEDCDNAIENYGTPWDGDIRFADIAHATKVCDNHAENDVLKFKGIAVFNGKSHKGQFFPETKHVWMK